MQYSIDTGAGYGIINYEIILNNDEFAAERAIRGDMVKYENDGKGNAKVELSGDLGELLSDVVVLCEAMYDTLKNEDADFADAFKEGVASLGRDEMLIMRPRVDTNGTMN
ncbi:MAG: hypothetical protein LUD72_13860 [Bacteroidales bacterium]|nr:hypothetical protein [Bacteroidales bacterium]